MGDMNDNKKCTKCGGQLEKSGDTMTCAGCGNTMKIHDTASTTGGDDGNTAENR